MTGVLSGIRVVEFAAGVAGPGCAQLLGDHGADVIKVEPPWGDWSREMGSGPGAAEMSSAFVSVNCNKRGICLNLKDPDHIAVAVSLVERADVVVESYRPHVLERLGLGYEQVKAINPRAVYASISGFGQDGPNSQLPSSDTVMQPYGGIMSVIGEAGGPPMRVGGVLVSDSLAGMNTFTSILLALYERERTGLGSRVNVALLDSIVAFQATSFTDYLHTGELPRRSGQRHPMVSSGGAFKAADGYVAVIVLDRAWSRFCQQPGIEGLGADERFSSADLRNSNRDALWNAMSAVFGQRTVKEWVEALRVADIPCAPVNDYADLVKDEQLLHNGVIGEVRVGDRMLPVVRPAIRGPYGLSEPTAPPRLGEHTEQVLREDLGWDDRQVSDWLTAQTREPAEAAALTSQGSA